MDTLLRLLYVISISSISPTFVAAIYEEKNFTRIVGGRYASIKEVPYQAQIIDSDDTICGATIISEYWLVSAAHCFVGSDVRSLSVATGASFSFSGEKHQIEKCIVHPSYTWHNHNDNDISLIKVKTPIKFKDNQRPILLASSTPKNGDVMKVSGYGWESLRKKRGTKRHLKAALLVVVDQNTCTKRYEEIFTTITQNSFCAGVNNTGSCTADSGGPGVIRGRLAGIVSAGYECNTSYYPGIYTDVHLYRKWISEHTGLKI